jgi:orotate phosphoribosyltransferase
MNAEQTAELLLASKAVILRPEEPFRFTTGILSPIYCDNRLLLSKVSEREKIVDAFVQKINNEKLVFDVVAGIATASITWASLIAEKLKKPMIYIRKEAKEHGMKNRVEGDFKKGERVLVVEDLVSTGSTSMSAVVAAREAGAVVEQCLAIFTYEMKVATEGFRQIKCALVTLSNFSTLVKVAAEWSKDPVGWHNG